MLTHISPTLLHVLYLVAITAEAMTAALTAGRRSMDWLGVAVIGSVTALGGGTVRDVLLGHYPLAWVAHPLYLWVTAVAAILAALVAPHMKRLRGLCLLLDGIGLVVFTVIGCQVAQQMQMPLTIVLVSGAATGCVGGVLRDVLCNHVPVLFRKELYASVSLLTGCLYLAAQRAGASADAAVLSALVFGLTLRMLALRLDWRLPTFVYRDNQG